MKIINTSTLQRKMGEVMEEVQRQPHIVISKSAAKMVLLPYFEGCDEQIEDYWRAIAGPDLKKNYQNSLRSGVSDLSV